MKTLRLCIVRVSLILFSAQGVLGATQAMDYDANGNLISGRGKFYEYNDANKLVRVREGGKEGPVIAQFWYDYRGQRVKKVEHGITTYYLGKQYEERKGSTTNEKTNFYFVGGQRVARKTRKDTDSAENFYYLNNHLGSAEVVTNAAGVEIDRLAYSPYGSLRNTGSERYSYTGKEKDGATGQFYYEARYYDALAHHFTQADTVTPNVYDPQSLNRYAYVKNNPITMFDPTGHFSIKLPSSDDVKKVAGYVKGGVKFVSGKVAYLYKEIEKIPSEFLSKDEKQLGKIAKGVDYIFSAEEIADKTKNFSDNSNKIDNNNEIKSEDKILFKVLRGFENIGSLNLISKWMTPGSGELLNQHGPSKYGEYNYNRNNYLKRALDLPANMDDAESQLFLDEYESRFAH